MDESSQGSEFPAGIASIMMNALAPPKKVVIAVAIIVSTGLFFIMFIAALAAKAV
jgi:hypothetical protein